MKLLVILAFASAVICIGGGVSLIPQSKRGEPKMLWGYGSLLFAVALPHALLMNIDDDGVAELKRRDDLTACPHCLSYVPVAAAVCRYCGRDVVDAPRERRGKRVPVEVEDEVPNGETNRRRAR